MRLSEVPAYQMNVKCSLCSLRVRDAHKFTMLWHSRGRTQREVQVLGVAAVVSRRMVDSKGEPRSREFIVTAAVSSQALSHARTWFISAVLSRPRKMTAGESYLEVQDDRPYQAEGEFRITVHDVLRPDVDQLDLLVT